MSKVKGWEKGYKTNDSHIEGFSMEWKGHIDGERLNRLHTLILVGRNIN